MDYQLVVVRGRSGASALSLSDGVTTVGRHDDCQVRIKSSQVSRKHCELFEKKGLLLVKDLGSANGTYVNGQKVDGQRVLEPGDELMIGQVKLRVEKKAAAPAAPESAAAPAAKRNDTAVGAPETEAVAAPVPANDDFDISFDIDFDGGSARAAANASEGASEAAAVDGSDIDSLLDEPIPPGTPAPTPAKAAAPSPEPAEAPAIEPGEDAVADFLLDINFDDEDR